MHHTARIRLAAARRGLATARQECPHWDYVDDGDGRLGCCEAVADARREFKLAREAVKREDQGHA